MTDETLLLRFWVSVLPLSALAFGRLIKASATWEGSQRYGDIACTLVWDSLGCAMGCILQVPTHPFSMKTSQDMWKPVLPIYTSRPAIIYVIHVSYSTLPSLCLWNESSSLLWPRVRGVVDCLKDPQTNDTGDTWRHMATHGDARYRVTWTRTCGPCDAGFQQLTVLTCPYHLLRCFRIPTHQIMRNVCLYESVCRMRSTVRKGKN